jgi:hypothetical protein
MPKISVSMQEYGSGWRWTYTAEDEVLGEMSGRMRTNPNGDGLWWVGTYEGVWAHNYEDNQILGTSQFWLPSERRAAYAKIRRYIEKTLF